MGDKIVVSFFYNLLKEQNKVHYSELLERLQCSDYEEKTFFDTYTDYGRRWFFESHSSLFRISGDGYVSLREGVKKLDASQARNSQKENGQAEGLACWTDQPDARFDPLLNASSLDAVIEDLVSTLAEHSSMHFLQLTKHQSKGTKSNVSQHFEPLSLVEKFLFFKNHIDVFNIDDEGYVTLKTSAPGDFDEGRKTDEDQVVDFFISVLRITRSMNHRKLVKHLQESNLDVKDYFGSYSDNELKKFFKNQDSRFRLQFYTSVSLQDEAVGCVTNTIERTRNVNYDDKCRRTKIENENKLVKSFISTLKEYGPMHYNALILICTKQKAKCFKQLTACEKISFFKEYPDTFSIVNNGYVSLNNEIGGILQEERRKENQVIEFFVSTLKSSQRMHRDDLGKLLKNSELDAKNYFGKVSGRKLNTFFSKHRSVFRKEKCSYVSLRENAAEFSEDNETSANVSESDEVGNTQTKGRSRICFTEELVDGKIFSSSSDSSSTFEKTIIETLVAALLEYGPMHYLALLKCAYVCPRKNKKYFDEFPKDDAFFRNHPDTFSIGSDGYVTLTDFAIRVKPKETEVLDYFTSLLKKSSRLPPQALVSRIKKSGLNAKDYFDSFSFTDVLGFFENHPSRFVLRHELNVSLPKEVMNSAEQRDSDRAERIHGVEAAKVNGTNALSCQDSCIPPHMGNRECCGEEENSILRTDETQNMLLPEDSVSCQAQKVSDWIFSCETVETSEGNAVDGCCNNLSTKSATSCSFKMADSKIDPFTLHKGNKRQDRSISENEISGSLANDSGKIPVMKDASSASTTLENTARSGLLFTNSSGSDFSASREAKPIPKVESVISSIDKKSSLSRMGQICGILSLADSHIQSIRYFVIALKDRNITHYHQLLYKACSYDRCTFNFFSKFTLADVLDFIRMHWMYFHVQCDGNVILVDSTISPSQILTSEDHVLQVTSVVDVRAVEFFVNILRQRTKMALIELKFYLGFAPGYVLSLFAANFHGEDFCKFFHRHPSYFHICEDEYVELILKIL